MCGIAGGVWPQSTRPQSQLTAAMRSMQYRGPDDSGFLSDNVADSVVGLAHVRLSILDLSAAGHQPMLSHDGRWVIIFNGEIYNYRELRSELKAVGYKFQSDTDTEVLLSAWSHWGSTCLPKLSGMFAFAILDRLEQTLTCVRDAFGIKPLYYCLNPGQGFRFASEPQALFQLLTFKPAVNWQRAYDYLIHADYDSNADTFFAGVSHLLPGHLITVNLTAQGAAIPSRWWSPCTNEHVNWSFADAVAQVREQFLLNISQHMRSDVPIGAALSGGIDSSAVVCAMRHLEPNLPINTFSYIATDGVSEERWVDQINHHANAISHKVYFGRDDLIRDLDELISCQAEPFGSTSIYAQHRVFGKAKQHGIKVVLDGQGADEMLAGYIGYPGQRLRSLLDNSELKQAYRFFRAWSAWPGRTKTQALKYLAAETTKGSLYSSLRRINGRNASPPWLKTQALHEAGVQLIEPRQFPDNLQGRHVIASLALALTRKGLPSLLRHADRNSMYSSIESRVPFLTLDMVDLLLSMPENFLISEQGETKYIFRHAMRGIVPDEVLDRRDKIGFETPEKDLLLGLYPVACDWLATDFGIPLLDRAMLANLFDIQLVRNPKLSSQLWRLLNFCRWHQLCL